MDAFLAGTTALQELPFIGAVLSDGVAVITFVRPPHNEINPVVVHSLRQAMGTIASDKRVFAAVLCSSGKDFSQGADLHYFARQAEQGAIANIEGFSRALHLLALAIGECSKPVVAAVHGAALGAGLELALACHFVVAARGATLALPETSIGICPGGGGTQLLPRRIGVGLAKWLIYTGQFLSANDALRIGLIDEVAPVTDPLPAALAAARRLASGARSQTASAARSPYDTQLEHAFTHYSAAQLLETASCGTYPAEWEPRVRKTVAKLLSRSSSALLLAEELIDRDPHMSLADALELEVAAQRRMFAHPDAIRGLAQAIAQRAQSK